MNKDMLQQFVDRARMLDGTVVFAEGDEERTLEAAVRLVRDGVCRAVAVAERKGSIEETARRKSLDLSGIRIVTPALEDLAPGALARFFARRQEKGIPEPEARRLALEPLQFAALYVASDTADAFVAGARSDTADVLRAALRGVPREQGVKLISSCFLMIPPAGHPLAKAPVLFADCAVNPVPGAHGLRDIAVETVQSFKRLFPRETARVVFLSFSTRGSARHPSLKKILDAVDAVKERFSGDDSVVVDGEFQFDAAVVPAIAERKAPGSPIRGDANILIFPDLNSGNIGYKMAERFAGFKAVGPVIQGLSRPFSDLSRGCSADDIYYVTAITLLQHP